MPFSVFFDHSWIRVPASRVWYLSFAVFFTTVLVMPEFLDGVSGASKNLVAVLGVGIVLVAVGITLFLRRHEEFPAVSTLFHPGLVSGGIVLAALGVVQFFRGFTQWSVSGAAFEPGTFISFFVLYATIFAFCVLAQTFGEAFVRPALFALGTAIILAIAIGLGGSTPFGPSVDSGEYRTTIPSSLHAAFSAYGSSPKTMLAGTGLHSYTDAWARFHPENVNATTLWNQDPSQAYGLLFTLAVSTGSFFLVLYAMLIAGIAHVTLLGAQNRRHSPLIRMLGGACILLLLSFVGYTPHLGIFVALGVMLGLVLALTGNVRADLPADASAQAMEAESGAMSLFAKPYIARWTRTLLAIVCISLGLVLAAAALVRAVSISAYSKVIVLEEAGAASTDVLAALELSVRYEHTVLATRAASETYYQEARTLLQKSDVTSEDRRIAEEYLNSANTHAVYAQMHGDIAYRAALRLGNINASLGVLRGSQEDLVAGIGHYHTAQGHAPAHPAAYFLEAQALSLTGDTAGARTVLRKALHLKPDYAEAQRLAGQLNP